MSQVSVSLHSSPTYQRRSPAVQLLQSAPKWVDFYSQSLSPLRISRPAQSQLPEKVSAPHGHPDPPPRWTNPRGYGARHINDTAPFSLWDKDRQKFRLPTAEERAWLTEVYRPLSLWFCWPQVIIITENPPVPVPLTVACVSAVFTPPETVPRPPAGSSPCVGPRIPDPCKGIRWPRWSSPKKAQMVSVIEALQAVANVRRVNFLPAMTVVELVHGDGREYPIRSLPGIVASVTTTYHHNSRPFFDHMKNHKRERLFDPAPYFPGPLIGPLPQDGSNYLDEPQWGFLTPGMRISTGIFTSGPNKDAVTSSTSGVRLRKNAVERITVANHRFLTEKEVFHPSELGVKIGDIEERYDELDIAMVRLVPSKSSSYSNNIYFQGEPPRRLVTLDEVEANSYFEVEGMSTGLITMLFRGSAMETPLRPLGHPPIPVLHWQRYSIMEIFGASNPKLIEGLCGAPIVEVDSGNVAGFFHLAAGDYAQCAALDDLIAEGWVLV
ncbi:hypothetical protein MMC31_003987 [Peltigera leucophlebia]|nr:hypothetical protein [Peltigera leucophlebia]